MSIPSLDERLWQAVLTALPVADLEASVRASGALRRARVFATAQDLLAVVWVYALITRSLRLTAVWANKAVGAVSTVAVLKRLRGCVVWLGLLCSGCLLQRAQTAAMPSVRVCLVDATAIPQPGITGTAWRVHVTMDVARHCITHLELTDVHGGETLCRQATDSGSIIIADRGYAHPRGLAHLAAGGAACIVRCHWQNLPLRDTAGSKLDIVAWLTTLAGSAVGECAAVLATDAGPLALRVIAVRLSTQATAAARRRIRDAARRKKRTPDPRSLAAAAFLYVVTNVPATRCTTADILALYRLRWQIEILFKQLKGVWSLGQLRTKDPVLAQVILFATLLAALVQETQMLRLRDLFRTLPAEKQRPLSTWRCACLWRRLLEEMLWGRMLLDDAAETWLDLRRYLCDTPRRRQKQTDAAADLLTSLQLLS